jgi:transcriptional regulator with XRE-family HTH domain
MSNPTPSLRIAASVRAEMARRRMSQKDLAELLGMTQPALSRRLTGEVPFAVDDLPLFAEALGVPVSVLMESVA